MFFCFKQKTAYEMRISDWSSYVCSSDLTLFLFILGLVMMASMDLLPPMLQNLYGYPVLETGMLLAARGLGVMVAMAASGRMMEKIDHRLMVFAGFVMMALTLWYMTRSEEHTSELQSLMRNSSAGICLKKKNNIE